MTREWLVAARGDLTHKEVATRADIKRQYYSMIENGARNPSVSVAKKIGAILGFNWTLFFDDHGNSSLPNCERKSTKPTGTAG